jgi:hypothetical protein
MTSKKQYQVLDDIGFVGTQRTMSNALAKKDIEMTIQHIKAKKSGKSLSSPKKNKR